MMSSNEKNLYSFYRATGSTDCISLAEGKNYAVVSGAGESWPKVVFDIRFDKSPVEQLNEILSHTIMENGARLAVCNRKNFNEDDQALFREYGVFPVEIWPMMEINQLQELNDDSRAEIDVMKLNNFSEVNDFASIVNSDLLKGQVVSEELFPQLLKCEGIGLYGAYHKGKMAGGLLSFTEGNGVIGLYFIVMRKEYRGLGLASAFVGSVVGEFFRHSAQKVVLQALPKAVTLYQKLGFIRQDELIIFRKH